MLELSTMRAGPLDCLAASARALPAVSLTVCPATSKLSLRGRPAVIEPAGAAFGVALPRDICRFAAVSGRAALRLGPDEWLLTAEANAGNLFERLETALATLPHALVDVSHRSESFAITGPRSAYILNHGCPLDLSLAAFPVGMGTRTLIGKAGVTLSRVAPETFHIDVLRSFACYLWSLLDEARQELA